MPLRANLRTTTEKCDGPAQENAPALLFRSQSHPRAAKPTASNGTLTTPRRWPRFLLRRIASAVRIILARSALRYGFAAHRDHQPGWPQQDPLRMLRNGQDPVQRIASPAMGVVKASSLRSSAVLNFHRPRTTAGLLFAPADSFRAELTGCSMTPDNRHGADGPELEAASKIFLPLRISRPCSASFTNDAEFQTWPLIYRCRSW